MARLLHLGFSLIELLVTIAVICVFIVLSGMAWQAIVLHATGLRCLARQHQIGMALLSYAADHNYHIPPRVEPDPNQPGKYLGNTLWFTVLREKGYTPSGGFSQKSLHFCPEFAAQPVPSGMEAYGLRRWKSPGKADDLSQSLLSLKDLSDFFILADSINTATSRQGYCIDGFGQWNLRSNRKGMVKTLFADGHVAQMESSYFADLHQRQAEYHVGPGPYQVQMQPAK